MSEVRFAAVIPTYQRAASVGRAVESVLAQRHPAVAIVVVDDGSTDETAHALARFGDLIEVVEQPHAGCAAARNRGVAAARAEWIAFLDSDDTWRPGHLGDLARAIQRTNGVAAHYFTDVRRPVTAGAMSVWQRCGFTPIFPHQLVTQGSEWVMRRHLPMMLQASAIRRSILIDAGGFDERLATREDTHLFLRLGLAHSLCAVGSESVEMGCGPSQLTRRFPIDSPVYLEATVSLYRDVLARCQTSPAHALELRRRLADAHCKRAFQALSRLRVDRALVDLAGAVRASPRALTDKLIGCLGLARGRLPIS